MSSDRAQLTPSRVPTGQSTARLDQVARLVQRHLAHPWGRAPNPAQRPVFDRILEIQARGVPLILDAGCGTGASTAKLAERSPAAHVIGVDKSAQRLTKLPSLPANATVLRGELVDLWLFAAAEGVRFAKLWLLYPNPWPKPAQLAKRWHGHAVFPTLMRTADTIELRTNWSIYAREAAHAMTLVLGRPVIAERFEAGDPLTPFERKYQASGHALWRICV